MLTDAQLARLSYAPMEKNSKRVHLYLSEQLYDAVARLADIEHRRPCDQLRHLLEIAVRCELERLDRQAESMDEVVAAMEREHKRTVRKVLAKVRKENYASRNLRESEHSESGTGPNDADEGTQGIHRAPRLAASR
jgi:hypothetical protein